MSLIVLFLDNSEYTVDGQNRFYVSEKSDDKKPKQIYEENKVIDGVIHFAGLKAVGDSISHPLKYWQTNVLGTKIISELSAQYQVEKFILISTDKAVSPSNCMGASKRLCEQQVQQFTFPSY